MSDSYQIDRLQAPIMDPRKASGHQDEMAQMRREIEKLRTEKQLQGDEIRALKVEVRSYQGELNSLNNKVKSLEDQALQETLTADIGKQVRLRYLEKYRQRMGKSIGKLGYDRIRRGDRAAHRGRPVVDALLCMTGLMTDPDVYANLYGVDPDTMKTYRDVQGVVDITGFRASLQGEGRLTKEFQVLFERLIKLTRTYASPMELKIAFEKDKTVQQLQAELQVCYDKILAANPLRQQNFSSPPNR